MPDTQTIIDRIISDIVNPFIYILFAFGLFMFVYGVVEFMHALSKGGNEKKLEQGRDHMIYGLVGLFIMVGVFGIVRILNDFFGFGLGPQGSYNPDMSLFNNINFQSIKF